MATRIGTENNDVFDASDFGEMNVSNRYEGKGGNDTLVGGHLRDVLIGGEGNDYLGGGDGADTLEDTGGASVYGDAGDDSITLNTANGFANGGTGDDKFLLIRTSGTMYGDQGDDLFTVLSSTGLALNGGQGDDIIYVGGGVATDRLIINGDAGDDLLSAGVAGETFNGGAGEDTISYIYASSAVTVDLARNAAGGAAAGDSWFRVENVEGSDYNDTIRGNGDYNYITGGAGNDIVSGDAGGDLLDGGDGLDRLDYSRSTAAVTVNLATGEASGGHADGDTFFSFESLEGSKYADVLIGSAGANRIAGGGGDDRLTGGGGGDVISGGAGADRFVYLDVTDSRMSSGRDTIYDFKRSDGDKIDLSAIDASISGSGNQAFTLIGTSAFTAGTQGQLNYRVYGGYVIVQGDINGDRVGDFSIQVMNVSNLAASDFVL
ncbi:calcium-binding protein [Methylopila musalis]|uniref:Calcium-binding protein n=1 Tax=Methylopila musalis TaxID=1134781 RepID=A0ABW3Z9Q5_9HYPH